MQEIDRVTSTMDDKTASAMRTLFIITEHENIPAADDLIGAAMQVKGRICAAATEVLAKYNLVDQHGNIPGGLKQAIRDCVASRHLRVRGPNTPHLKPDIEALSPRCE